MTEVQILTPGAVGLAKGELDAIRLKSLCNTRCTYLALVQKWACWGIGLPKGIQSEQIYQNSCPHTLTRHQDC